ncbi:MAG: plasmid pRiA4b ORF-3 family protein, partial [Bacteroidales bacterium]|nr:plasmid pRiA4b ORF-3 family protein [Bacteroidales bacterium]
HILIQVIFGWDSSHLYQFSENGFRSDHVITDIYDDMDNGSQEVTEASEVLLSDIFKKEKQKFTYIYDFGDSWEHDIVLEKIIPEISEMPELLQGLGTCPPEDCGGPFAYQEIKQILADKKHPEHKEYYSWLGLEENEVWDPDAFNLEETQSMVEDVFS